MPTTSFFAPPECSDGSIIRLPPEEASHATRVLRQREGDEITVVDGRGGRYSCVLTRVDPSIVECRIVDRVDGSGELHIPLEVCVGIIKNSNRLSFLVEKLVESGATRFTPLLTKRVEKRTVKLDRLAAVAVAAMKQSGRSRLMEIGNVSDLGSLSPLSPGELGVIAHEGEESRESIFDDRALASTLIRILIGPEGGFSDEEVDEAMALGYNPLSLGSRRLRTETAAIVAAGAAMLAIERAGTSRQKTERQT